MSEGTSDLRRARRRVLLRVPTRGAGRGRPRLPRSLSHHSGTSPRRPLSPAPEPEPQPQSDATAKGSAATSAPVARPHGAASPPQRRTEPRDATEGRAEGPPGPLVSQPRPRSGKAGPPRRGAPRPRSGKAPPPRRGAPRPRSGKAGPPRRGAPRPRSGKARLLRRGALRPRSGKAGPPRRGALPHPPPWLGPTEPRHRSNEEPSPVTRPKVAPRAPPGPLVSQN